MRAAAAASSSGSSKQQRQQQAAAAAASRSGSSKQQQAAAAGGVVQGAGCLTPGWWKQYFSVVLGSSNCVRKFSDFGAFKPSRLVDIRY
jgi:hypothetical protein